MRSTISKLAVVLVILVGIFSCTEDDSVLIPNDRFQGEWIRESYTVLMSTTGELKTFEYQEGQAEVFLNVIGDRFEWITESGIDGVADYTLRGSVELNELYVDGILTIELEPVGAKLKFYYTEDKETFFATYKVKY